MLTPIFFFGPITYFQKVISEKTIIFEKHEHFIKQSFRNRMEVFGPNGVQKLVVPISGKSSKTAFKDVTISYAEPWQKLHLRSLKTAYSNSPFYFHYEDKISNIYENDFKFLCDLNMASMAFVCEVLHLDLDFSFSNEFVKPQKQGDIRYFDFKKEHGPKYFQNFENKLGFKQNLSILDLIFMQGPQSFEILNK